MYKYLHELLFKLMNHFSLSHFLNKWFVLKYLEGGKLLNLSLYKNELSFKLLREEEMKIKFIKKN